MEYRERELTEIATALKSINKSLKDILEIARANKSAPTHGDDCSRCLCSVCENRLTCKLKPDEILQGVYGSPCNGCGPGQCFMPVGLARCKNYKMEKKGRS